MFLQQASYTPSFGGLGVSRTNRGALLSLGFATEGLPSSIVNNVLEDLQEQVARDPNEEPEKAVVFRILILFLHYNRLSVESLAALGIKEAQEQWSLTELTKAIDSLNAR